MIARNPEYPDKRQVHRVDVLGDLVLRISDEKSKFNGDAMNLSSNGIHFLSLVRLPMFREVDVHLQLPKATHKGASAVHCHGVVVRCIRRVDPFFEISLFFVDLPDGDKHKIQHYMEQVASHRPLGPL